MNRLKKISVAAALLSAVGVASSVAIAGPEHHHDKKMHHKKMLMKKLELTEAQKAQVKANKEQRQLAMKASREEMRSIKKELNLLMQSENLDQNRLRSLLQQEANLKAQKMTEKHAAAQRFNEMLTDEQRVKFAELKAKMKEKRIMHREKRQARREARKAKAE